MSVANRFFDAIRHKASTSAAEADTVDAPLPDARYVLVVSYKRSGEAVPTPVWGARDGERLVFRSEADTAKVRRIRNNPRVRVAVCDARGKPKGPPVEATARITGPRDDAAERALTEKHGFQRRVYQKVASDADLVYVEITK